MRAGLGLREGSAALILLRVLWLALLSAPSMLAAYARIGARFGRMPNALEAPGALPLDLALELWSQAATAMLPLLALALPCFLVVDWALTAAASELLAPGRASTPPRVLRSVGRLGRTHFGVFVRIALLSGAALAVGGLASAGLLRFGRPWIESLELPASLELVGLPLLLAVGAALWGALVGAAALSARVLCVADSRARAGRAVLETLRLFTRAPVLPCLLVVSTLALQLAGAFVLARFYPPSAVRALSASAVLPAATWLVYLVAHAWIWHARIAWVRLAYADPRHDDVRERGDAPLGRGTLGPRPRL